MSKIPDLAALVCVVRSAEALVIREHMGRAIQQLALDVVRRADPDLSARLHDDSGGVKPYAVSGLLRMGSTDPVAGSIRSGEYAWLRLVGLSTEVTSALLKWVSRPPAQIEIDRAGWHLEAVYSEPSAHPWAGRADYAALMRQYHTVAPPRELDLEFVSPTSFHSGGTNLPLPLPALVFGSLASRWSAFSPIPLPDDLALELDEFFSYLLVLTRHQVATDILTFKKGSRQIGFTGRAVFHVLPRNTTVDRLEPELAAQLSKRRSDLARFTSLLARFAFFSGVGIKTAQGMGMVRRVGK